MSENSSSGSLPERQIPDEQIENYRDFYVELLGFVPPRIQARTDLLTPQWMQRGERLFGMGAGNHLAIGCND